MMSSSDTGKSPQISGCYCPTICLSPVPDEDIKPLCASTAQQLTRMEPGNLEERLKMASKIYQETIKARSSRCLTSLFRKAGNR